MGMEIIFIALLVLLLFGGKRMPEVLRELGKASREFKRVREELTDAVTREMHESPVKSNYEPHAERPETEDASAAMHEGEIPPEYAEFATLPPETTDVLPAAKEPDAEEAKRLSLESSAAVPGRVRSGDAPTTI